MTSILYRAGRVYIDAGQLGSCKTGGRRRSAIASENLESQLYHRIIGRGVGARAGARSEEAVSIFSAIRSNVADTWLGHLGLGGRLFAGSQFIEAQGELKNCERRPGEATAVFLDDVPSYAQFPPGLLLSCAGAGGMGGPGTSELAHSSTSRRTATNRVSSPRRAAFEVACSGVQPRGANAGRAQRMTTLPFRLLDCRADRGRESRKGRTMLRLAVSRLWPGVSTPTVESQ